MKKLLLLPILLLAFIATSHAQETTFETAGLENKMIALDGKEIAFKDILQKHKGKTIVIDVWASWCPDCIKGMPKVKELQEEFQKNTVYLFLSMDKNADAWKKGIEKYEVKGEHYLVTDGMKGIFGKSIKLDWIPRYMIVDKKGKIVLYKAIVADDEKLITTLKNLK
ncbi:TlpA family protein disulfide reductase [Flavobacterium kingsejongi]|uniref:Alkyl hydroperoxide reductase n=1 Tax=Flavobacterium kingsejongi TaxID=1678728 RepID=A0A2S1LSU7_9FLAO|nr:TlpA disulfide reductase family protein [Flavobacterium kingsejongi]AWG26716.1 alkyl hydroperoxide reductase [Flavobacterium kingsejongi]